MVDTIDKTVTDTNLDPTSPEYPYLAAQWDIRRRLKDLLQIYKKSKNINQGTVANVWCLFAGVRCLLTVGCRSCKSPDLCSHLL